MKIITVGLGLIGGSLCKAIKSRTEHTVYGVDINKKVIAEAVACGAIDGEAEALSGADIVFVCLHPKLTTDYILEHMQEFTKGTIVADVCGVKQYVEDAVARPAAEAGVRYVGTHPMAGRQFSGFEYALEDLFDGASFIIAQNEYTDKAACDLLAKLAGKIGFTNIVRTTADIHDRNIAFTSQLAHVVSNAYIKSPAAEEEHGFSAGSFLDLTRVAYLNAGMWTELFMANKKHLSNEIGTIIGHLSEYKAALDSDNAEQLKALLQTGSDRKAETLKNMFEKL